MAEPQKPQKLDLTGFYQGWDAQARESLMQHAAQISAIATQTLSVTGPDHELIFKDDTASDGPRIQTFFVVQNAFFGQWDIGNTEALLADPAARKHLTNQVIAVAKSSKVQRIIFDFEGLPNRAQPNLATLIRETRQVARSDGIGVEICVPAGLDAAQYQAFDKASDGVWLMAYDEHWPGGEAGPIASLGWFQTEVTKVARVVRADRLRVIIGNYGYDWGPTGPARAVSGLQAQALAGLTGASRTFDPGASQSRIDYSAADGRHRVWLLDSHSALLQIKAAQSLGISHFGLWRLGSEDPDLWSNLIP